MQKHALTPHTHPAANKLWLKHKSEGAWGLGSLSGLRFNESNTASLLMSLVEQDI